MDHRLATAVGQELDSAVVGSVPLAGGDFAKAFQVTLADDRTVFVKTHPDPPAGFFTTEANGLNWLSESRTVPVPKVLAFSDDPAHLVLEWVTPGRPDTSTDEEFGRDLARLHLSGAPHFGRADCRTTGSQALPNDPADSWVEFYATRRLLPLAEIAERRRSLPTSTVISLRKLAERLPQVAGAAEAPARLHGDLWAGNRLVDSAGRSWLIDPACFGGHREFDLSMMKLFGGFGPRVFSAYDEQFPLAAGWRDRVALNQVAPLVVHAVKFGGGYVDAAAEAIRPYL